MGATPTSKAFLLFGGWLFLAAAVGTFWDPGRSGDPGPTPTTTPTEVPMFSSGLTLPVFDMPTPTLVPPTPVVDPLVYPDPGAPVDAQAQVLLYLINEYRVNGGQGILSYDADLTSVAEFMADDLATRLDGVLAHTDSAGLGLAERLLYGGVWETDIWRGEVIAAGTQTPQATLQIWKDSAPHNEVLVSPNFARIGVGMSEGPNTLRYYWVAVLASY